MKKTKAEKLLKNLVNKLIEIVENDSYNSVFTVASNNGVTYDGPCWGEELSAAKKYLDSKK